MHLSLKPGGWLNRGHYQAMFMVLFVQSCVKDSLQVQLNEFQIFLCPNYIALQSNLLGSRLWELMNSVLYMTLNVTYSYFTPLSIEQGLCPKTAFGMTK